jgi:hypothetical protein
LLDGEITGRSFLHPSPSLPLSHSPALALSSSSSSGHFDTKIAGNPREFLDYEQEAVRVQDKEEQEEEEEEETPPPY